MTHYSCTAKDPKGREYLIIVLPPNDPKIPPAWKWEIGVVVHVDGAVIPLNYWTVYANEAGKARQIAANMASRIEEGDLLMSADIYIGKEGKK